MKTRHMGKTELIAMAIIWTTVTMIGTDIYLPALPSMDEVFPVSDSLINLTVTAYIAGSAIGGLIGGPLSDKLGRRGPFLVSGLLFFIFTALCTVAFNIWLLIIFRFIAGGVGATIMTLVNAILKDELEGKELDKGMTVVQSLTIAGPVVAPFIGSFMLGVMGWRGIFLILAVFALACYIWVLPLAETLPPEKRAETSVAGSLLLTVKVARNSSFTLALLILFLPAIPFGAFLAVCSYVFIDYFSLSSFGYSCFFATVSLISVVSPFIYLNLRKVISLINITRCAIALLAVCGILFLVMGKYSPMLFLVSCIPFIIAEGIARPCGFFVLLNEEAENAGSASALISLSMGVLTSIAMPLGSAPWSSYIVGLGWINIGSAILAAVLFIVLIRVLKSGIFARAEAIGEEPQ